MEKSNAAAIPARRPWYRLHLSTWLTLPLGLVFAVLIVVPGGVGQYPERTSWVLPFEQSALVHGWPLPYLWRTPQGWSGDPAQASRYLPWKLTDSVREFRLLPLVVDLALAGMGLALFAALVEWRRRRRRATQFSLRELLGFAMLMAVAFAWWGHQRAIDREMTDHFGRLHGLTDSHLVPRAPLWLRMLVGDDKLARLGINGPDGTIQLRWDLSRRKDIQFVVEQFPHETSIEMGGAISSDDAAAVAEIQQLEQIECDWTTSGVIPSSADMTRLLTALEGHSHLRHVRIAEVTEPGLLDDAHMAKIATLPQLESLEVEDASALTGQGLVELKNCKNLRELELFGMRLTNESLDHLGTIKQLRRLDLWGGQFEDADLKPLGRLDGLESFDASGTNLDDDETRQLRTIGSLRYLNVGGTQLSNAGVKQLLDPANSLANNIERITLGADLIDQELIAALKKLPRLHSISFVWTVADPLGDTRKSPNYRELISDVQKALPSCDVVSEQLPYVSS